MEWRPSGDGRALQRDLKACSHPRRGASRETGDREGEEVGKMGARENPRVFSLSTSARGDDGGEEGPEARRGGGRGATCSARPPAASRRAQGSAGTAGFLGSPAEPPAGMKRTGEGVVVVRGGGGGSSKAARGGSTGAGRIGPGPCPQPAGEWKVFPE